MTTGSHAAVRYDGSIFGTPPSKRRKLRQALGSVACAHGPGRCLTTALALDHGLGDPAYYTATDTLHI